MTHSRETADTGSFADDSRGSYNTMRKAPKLRRTFRMRMAIFFGLTAIMTAIVLSVVLGVVWESQFQSYTRENMQRLAQTIADTLATQYEQEGEWTSADLSKAVSAAGISSDVSVQVTNAAGDVIFDDTWTTSEEEGGSRSAATSAVSVILSADEDSVVSAPVMANEQNVGTVSLWALDSMALVTKRDAAFRSSSYWAIWTAAVAAVIIACVMGIFSSKQLTKPVKVITSTAAQIRNGDLTARTGLTGEDEIGRLGETFDSMANTIEHDIKIERRLTNDVAHELRTPLMAMLATVEAMQDGVLPADNERLEVVASETRRLSRLVDAMLRLSRLENGKSKISLQRTDVVYLVKSLVSVQHQLFKERGLHLRFDDKTPRHECYAYLDQDMITEAVTNIMSNAMRYTNEGGWVVVSVAQEKGDVLISVKDTGIGIAKEDISKIFSRFWRSDTSRERVSGGLGVGLSITKEIIDQHNGTISVESKEGEGTTFVLRIPSDGRSRTKSKKKAS